MFSTPKPHSSRAEQPATPRITIRERLIFLRMFLKAILTDSETLPKILNFDSEVRVILTELSPRKLTAGTLFIESRQANTLVRRMITTRIARLARYSHLKNAVLIFGN